MYIVLKDIIDVVRYMGLRTLIAEGLRRLTRRGYYYNGIFVDSRESFRALFGLRSRNFVIRGWGRWVYCKTSYGTIAVSRGDISLLHVLIDPIEEFYDVDVRGAVVLDIGAYIGDTALYFASRGARLIYAYEPVKKFYDYLKVNTSLNKLRDVIAVNKGVWREEGVFEMCLDRGSSRMGKCREIEYAYFTTLENALKQSSSTGGRLVVKLDCEGCEETLLYTPCDILRLADTYAMEVHGSLVYSVPRKLEECGYRLVKKRRVGGEYIYTYSLP